MFDKILIANRGEIACRIIATCRRLGIGTVAVFSEADASARHVRLADTAHCIGPAAAAGSYLRGERIIHVARVSCAQAIHPGYGFLSENAAFAQAVEAAGLTLIGPSAETMELMGSKAAAKARMAPAGVPLIPGYHGDDQSDAALLEEAQRIGFPLMLKAAAGGGGKGMRVVKTLADFAEALKATRREASGAFGDQRMILERYLEQPRHIEAQIFADVHGNTVHLFERDCSSQRRHQKIIEEAPAPHLPESLRAELLAAAVRAAEAVHYRGAGTVEFLVDGDEFFFLEMNTRLQVEHPVTEQITGLDLVEWQIRVAAGQPLPLKQDQIQCRGHAMEARIYAEDPARGFVPSSGSIHRLQLPTIDNLRIDAGVEAGDEVSVHYDPMIAKLVVHADQREACLGRLREALSASMIDGPQTNLGFLQALAASEAFTQGRIDTGLLDRAPETIPFATAPGPEILLAAAAHWLMADEPDLADGPWARCDGWRLGQNAPRSLDIDCGDERQRVEAWGYDGDYRMQIDGGDAQSVKLVKSAAEGCYRLVLSDRICRLWIHEREHDVLDICLGALRWTCARHSRLEASGESSQADGRILAPMPGKILELRVEAGASVTEGDTLLVMEAMKMELAVKAPFTGLVDELAIPDGSSVEADAWLLTLKPHEHPAG